MLMETEAKIIGIIEKTPEKKAYVSFIAERLGFSTHYVGYLCKYLATRGFLSRVAETPTYALTPEGEKELRE